MTKFEKVLLLCHAGGNLNLADFSSEAVFRCYGDEYVYIIDEGEEVNDFIIDLQFQYLVDSIGCEVETTVGKIEEFILAGRDKQIYEDWSLNRKILLENTSSILLEITNKLEELYEMTKDQGIDLILPSSFGEIQLNKVNSVDWESSSMYC